MEIVIGVAAGLILAVIGFAVGRSAGFSAGRALGRNEGHEEGRGSSEGVLSTAAERLARGALPEGAEPGSAEAKLYDALRQGWAPRETEREHALREAIGRVSAYLENAVRAPLAGAGEHADAAELRERIERALGSLQDLDFFIREPAAETEGRDVAALIKQVTREFALDQAVAVRLRLDGRPVRAKLNAQAFMDALYLVLHNAGRFGGGETVEVTAVAEDGRVVVRVRDRGPGFTKEAFIRAFDPFYSTTDEGLGLGLPHARKVLEAMGGRIELRNAPDGGAEVEISFSAA